MEFDENEEEEQEEETGNQQNYETPQQPAQQGGRAPRLMKGGGGGGGGGSYRYRECLKNHAVGIGGHATDGCGEFMPSGDEGSLDALICAACTCHRNFHRKEPETGQVPFHHHHHHHSHGGNNNQQLQQHQPQLSPFYHRAGPAHAGGYLQHGHVASAPPPHQQRGPLAGVSRELEEEDVSNPSSSGGGGGGGAGKRFRTRFTQEQKDKMLEFAERVGWRIQKGDEGAVEQFCGDIGVRRQVLKVWMHNNKHTLARTRENRFDVLSKMELL